VGGASATKALTLNATGANSAITQSAAIKSTGLELLGANASYTLTNTGNDIKKIAGNTKLVSLTNNSAFAIDTVNTIGLTTSGNTTFNSTASVTENQKIDTAGLELLGVGGSYTLTNTGNNIRKIAGNTGSVSLTNNSAFAVDTVNTLGLTTTGNTTFRSTAAVTQTQKVAAAGLELLGTGGSYTLTNTSNNVANLAANTGTVSFVDSADLTVGTVNTSGITTTAGDVTLVSNNGVTVAANITSNGNDIAITANGNGGSSKGFEQSAGTINASAGDIAIVGTTKTATGWPNRVGAGLRGNLTGNNIAITGTSDTASAIDGIGVQIEGATSVSAAGTITVAGEVKGGGTGRAVVIGNGPHTPTILSGANGIDIHGTLSSANSGSADNAGVFIDASGVTATSANGAITITGDSSGAGAGYSKNAVVLKYAMNLAAQNGTTIEGTSIGTGASVNIDPEANISITTGALTIQTGGNNASTAFITSGMNARITQNSNAGVTLTTEGQGNITAPKIVNNGTGDVVVAAGKSISAGTATGGQVLTVAGNSIIQNSTGKTYIYSGATDSTGSLNVLTNNFDELYFGGTSHAVNTGFNTAYDGSPVNDLTAPVGGSVSGGAQAFFRSNTKPNFAITLADIHKTYGGADPANQTALNAALLSAYASASGASKLTSTVTSAAGSNTFAVTAADVINTLSGGTARAAGTNVGSYAFTSLSGASTNTTLSTAQLVIDKRDITLDSLTANTKPYDGNTTADIVGASFNNTYNNETLALTGRGYFDSQHVNDVSTVTVTDVTTLTKANGTGAWSNYNLTSTGAHTSSATGKITPVDLTATVNSSGIYVTQAATSARDMGVSYTGFVNGESVSTALTGTATRSYTGAQANPAAGTHANVFGLATTPTANHGNYNIATVVAGDLVVAPADKLFITIDSQNDVYGNRTAANSGKAANNSISAMYCLDGSDCSGSNLVPLTVSRLTDTRWKAADNTGSYVVFDTSIAGTSYSTGGYLNTGNYTFSASEIAPLSLFTNNVANFTGRFSNGGVLTVTALPVQLSTTPVSKAYDGNTTLPSLQLSAANALGGDDLDTSFVSGSYASSAASTAASFSLFGLQLSGVDMSNYTLSNNTYTGIGAITGSSSEKKPFIHPPKPIIPTNNTNSGEAGGGESGGSTAGNPYLLVPNNRNNSADRCTPNTLEDCLCETQEPKPLEGLAICYQPKKTASTRSNNKAKQS
jgi:hypothetical protein